MIEFVIGVVVSLAVNEMCDVSPWLARKCVRVAARWQFEDPELAEGRAEELTALIDDRPGKLFKLGTALGFLGCATWAMTCRSTRRRASIAGRSLLKSLQRTSVPMFTSRTESPAFTCSALDDFPPADASVSVIEAHLLKHLDEYRIEEEQLKADLERLLRSGGHRTRDSGRTP
ncbi:hypothetical protein [Herbidospora sp. RD11066]